MAQGYLTEDGTFFENKAEAVLYEAELRLRSRLTKEFNSGIDPEKFLGVVLAVMPEMREYINAYHATKPDTQVKDREETSERREAEISTGVGHVSSAEEDLASLLKLPTRRPSDVPDVGSGSRTEKVQKRRPKHGA